MDFLDSRYFRISKLFLSFLGLWPYQTPNIKCLTLSFSVFGVMTTLLPQIIYFFKHWDNLDKVFEIMPMTCAAIINLIKIVGLACNSKQFSELLRRTQEDWDNLPKNQEMQIATRYVEIDCVLVFMTGYALTPIATFVLDIISPLNETRAKKLLYSAEYLVDEEKYYYVLLLSEYIGYVVCILVGTSTDVTYFMLLEHICGMHAILCDRLENLKVHYKLRWVDDDESYGSDGIDRDVRRCILLDKRIRIYIEILESAFATSILIDIAAGSLLYTCTCVMIVIQADRLFKILQLVGTAIVQTVRFFLISWTGQKVIDHSSDVPIAAYDAMWYNMPIEVQKMIMLLITRSQKPSRLILAGIYVINLQSFSLVMRTSISYCTVMISLRAATEKL